MEKNMIEQKFSTWYQSICMNPTNEQLHARFKSIYEYVDSESLDIESIVRIYFGLPCDEQGKEDFVSAIFENDASFISRDNELACLAGMVIYYILQEEYECIDEMILSFLSLSVIINRNVIQELNEHIVNYMSRATADYREIAAGKLSQLKQVGYASLKEETLNNWDEDTKNTIVSVINKMGENISILKKNESVLHDTIGRYKEDSDILAWIVGEWSDELDFRLDKKVDGKKVAIVLGKELSNLVNSPLGPYSAKSLLTKMISMCKKDSGEYSLKDIICGTPREWRVKFVEENRKISDSTPISFCIMKSLEADDAILEKLCNPKLNVDITEIKMNIVDWSYSFFIECQLIKLLAD